MGNPTLDEAAAVTCPPEKPFKCLKYAYCFGFDQYCDQKANDVASCFPSNVKSEEAKLGWCNRFQRGEETLLDPSCQFACQYTFNNTFGDNISLASSSSPDLLNPLAVAGWIICIISLIANLYFVYKFCIKKKPQRGCITFYKNAIPPEEPLSPEDDSDASDDVDRRKDRKLVPSHSEATITSEDTTTPLQPSGGRSEWKKNPEDQRPLLPDQAITLRHSNSDLAGGHSEQYGQDDDRSSSSSAATGNSSSSPGSSRAAPQAERENGRHSPSTSSTGQSSEESARGQNASDSEGSPSTSQAERHNDFLRSIHVNQTQPDSDGSHKIVTSGAPYRHLD